MSDMITVLVSAPSLVIHARMARRRMARRVARTDSATAPRGIVTTLIEPREVLMTKSKTLECFG